MGWQGDKAWSDQFIPSIKSIVGPLLLTEAPLEVDQKQATDLIVMRARDMMIAARVRRPGYHQRYATEFTVRNFRATGAKTEWQKVVEGFGDWMFYGHAAEGRPGHFARWMVVDLHALRAHLIVHSDVVAPTFMSNGDGTGFAAFDVLAFPSDPPILVASSHPEELQAAA